MGFKNQHENHNACCIDNGRKPVRALTCTWAITAGCIALAVMPMAVMAQQSPEITLRTLAQIQRWQDEMNLRERIDVLQGKRREKNAASSALRASAMQTGNTEGGIEAATLLADRSPRISALNETVSARQPQSKNRQHAKSSSPPGLRLLAVYGPNHRMQAEAVDAAGQIHALEEKDSIGRWIVRNIRHEGILLHRDDASAHREKAFFIAVGESLDEGTQP